VGTYVRVLLSDLAGKLATVGHLTALRRLSSGHHHVRDALTLEGLAGLDDVTTALSAPVRMVDSLESVQLSDEDQAKMRFGQRVALTQSFAGVEIAGLDARGDLVGVLTRRGDLWKPEIVLADAGGPTCA
jgi:tRNA pseudouridine55 synthase